MMKNNIFLIALLAIVFSGCGGEDSANEEESSTKTKIESTKDDVSSVKSDITKDVDDTSKNEDTKLSSSFDESLRGEWVYIHDNTKVYIDENFEDNITKVDDKLIVVHKNSTSYHLMRYGNDSVSVNGNLYEENKNTDINKAISRLSNSRIGGMNVILRHYKDRKNDKKIVAKENGKFQFQNVKTGEYILEATSNIEENNDTQEKPLTVKAKVSIKGEEVSLGGFKLVTNDGYNFKTEFLISNSEGGYLFGNQITYDGKMIINNIGDKEGVGLNYKFKSDSPYILSLTNEIVLGTVDVNGSIEIPFHVAFNVLDKSSITIPLEVTIKDANNNEWYDTVFLKVYQTPMHLNIATKDANVKGYIIEDGHNLKQINTSDASIVLPYKAGESYYLVLSNPNVDNETPYSLAIDTDTLDFSTFQETGIFEPNNKESEATTLKMDEAILSYLHKGDIDYFIIEMSNSEDVGRYSPPQMPFK